MDRKVNLIYIAGYGRSGTTLLDMVLGRHPELTSVGEFTNLTYRLMEDRRCTCGEPVRSCQFWTRMLEGIPWDSENNVSYGYGRIKQFGLFFRYLFRSTLSGKDYNVAELNYRILKRVIDDTDALYVVDSSKGFGRLSALLASGMFDIKVLHLIRDGRGVAYSVMKPVKVKIERLAKYLMPRSVGHTTRRWAVTNLMVFLYRCLLPRDNYILIRYEDFAGDPENVLAQVLDFVGVKRAHIDMQFSEVHNIGGNVMRFGPLKEIKTDRTWEKALTFNDRLMFILNGGALINLMAKLMRKK